MPKEITVQQIIISVINMMGLKIKHIFFLSLIITLSVALGGGNYKIRVSGTDIYCTSDSVAQRNDDKIKAIYTLRMNKGRGRATITGTLYHNQKVIGHINRDTDFEYTGEGVSYSLVSVRSTRNNIDNVSDDTLSTFVPSFFIKADVERAFDIFKISSSGWLFVLQSEPFLLCNNVFKK